MMPQYDNQLTFSGTADWQLTFAAGAHRDGRVLSGRIRAAFVYFGPAVGASEVRHLLRLLGSPPGSMATRASPRVTRGQASTGAMPKPVRVQVRQCFADECIHPLLGGGCKQQHANSLRVAAGGYEIAKGAILCKHHTTGCKNSYHPGARLVFVVPTAVAG